MDMPILTYHLKRQIFKDTILNIISSSEDDKINHIKDIPATTLPLRMARVKYSVTHIHPLFLLSLLFPTYFKF